MDSSSPSSSVAASPSLTTTSTFANETPAVSSPPQDAPPASVTTTNTSGTTLENSAPVVKVESSAYLLEEPSLREVMLSDVGIESLLARLKRSYQTSTNIANYLKKRASIESDRLSDLRRLSKSTRESIHRSDYRQGTFVRQFDEALVLDERLFDASNTFLTAIHQMHEELTELSKTSHRSRKSLKESCLRNERNVIDAENNAEKAKSRYYGLCDDMEKLKDPNKTKIFRSKNTQQQEHELQTKINSSEQEYYTKIETAKKLRKELVNTLRPHSIKDLKNLILECDSGVSYQLQRLATINETMLLQQGFIIAPIKPSGSTTAPLSLKEVMAKVDNELDFYNDILKIKHNKTLNRPEIKFVKHPYMIAFDKVPSSSSNTTSGSSNLHAVSSPRNITSTNSQFNALKPPSQQTQVAPSSSHLKSASTSSALGMGMIAATASASSNPRNPNSMLYPEEQPSKPPTSSSAHQPILPYPDLSAPLVDITPSKSKDIPPAGSTLDPGIRSRSQSPSRDYLSPTVTSQQNNVPDIHQDFSTPSLSTSASLSAPIPAQPAGPYVPTFGSSLDELVEYENLPVATPIPRVVSKCVGAITRFGMSIEGVYRETGDATQIETLRTMFDESSESVDLLNPQKYGISDIHSVSGVLKLYFQELPDPLLTRELHSQFIQAASIDSDYSRREAIHVVVNDLPDANYSVLKFMALHLYRVSQHEAQNRMSVSTLGNMWGSVFMASETQDINELALQGRVIETILYFCDEIFDYSPDFYESVGADM